MFCGSVLCCVRRCSHSALSNDPLPWVVESFEYVLRIWKTTEGDMLAMLSHV
jgi:hypothetical protein